MTDKAPEDKGRGLLLKVLKAHFRELVAAGSDRDLLKQYAALLRFLKSGKVQIPESHQRPTASRPVPTLSEEELNKASLDNIARLVSDDATPRKDLEFIATQRFSVPRGSMRSFSNKRMLVDKLLTLIDNERTHQTIRAVARGQAKGNI